MSLLAQIFLRGGKCTPVLQSASLSCCALQTGLRGCLPPSTALFRHAGYSKHDIAAYLALGKYGRTRCVVPWKRPAQYWATTYGTARQACTCAVAAETHKPTVPAQPGTVNPYNHHIMIRLPQPVGHSSADNSIWWPPVMEKHPALLQAFQAVADHGDKQRGAIKITAYEHMDLADKSGDQSKVDMLIFPAGNYFSRIPQDKIHELVSYHIQCTLNSTQRPQLPSLGRKSSRGVFKGIGLFICTHMSRDTRCGRVGYQLAQRLQELVDERGYDQVHIYQASHVGGHKFAGNVLVYGGVSPCDGEWFGGLTHHDAERFLDHLVNMEVGNDGGVADQYLRQFWRGSMALSKEEQLAVFENPKVLEEEDFEMSDESSTSSGSSSSSSDGEAGT